jgi:hypothetical protein
MWVPDRDTELVVLSEAASKIGFLRCSEEKRVSLRFVVCDLIDVGLI